MVLQRYCSQSPDIGIAKSGQACGRSRGFRFRKSKIENLTAVLLSGCGAILHTSVIVVRPCRRPTNIGGKTNEAHDRFGSSRLGRTAVAGPCGRARSLPLVRFSDVGSTDIKATTSAATLVLEALDIHLRRRSCQVTFESLRQGDTDAFLGNGMPLQEPQQKPLVDAGELEVVRANLEGVIIGYAVPKAAHDAGFGTYDDIAVFRDEPGAGQVQGKIRRSIGMRVKPHRGTLRRQHNRRSISVRVRPPRN